MLVQHVGTPTAVGVQGGNRRQAALGRIAVHRNL